QLPARGPRDRSLRREHDLVHRQAGRLEHPAAALGLEDVVRDLPLRLDNDDGAIWVTRRGGRERRDAAGPDTGRAVHRRLEVVGEIVPAADDDRLLPPAADVELAIGHVPEIT